MMNKIEGKFIESCKHYERYSSTPSEIAQRLYYYAQWAGCFVCNPDFYITRYNYQSFLLLYTFQGRGKLLYRNKEYILKPNSIALINCMEKHTYFPTSENEWSFCFIHFNGNQCPQLYEHIYEMGEGCLFNANNKIEKNIKDCIQNCRQKNISNEVVISKLLSNILHELLLNMQKAEQDKAALICDYIAENYSQPLTTAQLAKTFGFSRCYFSTLFKKYTGTTLHDYLLCYRLDKAKLMLAQNQHTINEIAEKTGFNDTGTFIRAFKKKEKVTPLQYKKLINF